jgi:tripartite-type tricarboxylate transporter receptor subunit TctC
MQINGIPRRFKMLLVLVLSALGLLIGAQALAQDYPARAVRIIVPSPPGDGSDLIARSIAQRLSEDWGKPVVVENRAGAGGRIGTETAVRAANDGYTLLMGNAGANGINAAIYPNLPYRLETDFDPITQVIRAPNVLVVNPALGVKTVAELIALFKAQPGKYAYASGGVGSSAHLSAELFKLMAGVDLLHVPYKGAGGALNGVITGDVVMFLGNLPPAVPHIRAGRVQALGVTSLNRSPMLPDAPTLHETGLRDFETIAWFGLFAPAGVPTPVIHRIHQSVVRAVALPETRELFEKIGGTPVANSPAEFRSIVLADIAKWRRVVAAAGITGQ